MDNERRVINILGLIVTLVVLIGIVMFKYMQAQQYESVFATVLYVIVLIGSICTFAFYYIHTKRDKSDYE